MTAVYLGSMTLGAAVPAADVAAQAGVDGIHAAMPDLQGRLDALGAMIASLSTLPLPEFADMLARAEATTAAVTLAIQTPGLPGPPGFDPSQIADLLNALSTLQASFNGLAAKLDAIASFRSLLGTAGVHVVAYDGDVNALGSQLQAAIASPVASGHVNALLLATTTAAAWAGVSQIFKVSP